jgi:hypothetical protein
MTDARAREEGGCKRRRTEHSEAVAQRPEDANRDLQIAVLHWHAMQHVRDERRLEAEGEGDGGEGEDDGEDEATVNELFERDVLQALWETS